MRDGLDQTSLLLYDSRVGRSKASHRSIVLHLAADVCSSSFNSSASLLLSTRCFATCRPSRWSTGMSYCFRAHADELYQLPHNAWQLSALSLSTHLVEPPPALCAWILPIVDIDSLELEARALHPLTQR